MPVLGRSSANNLSLHRTLTMSDIPKPVQDDTLLYKKPQQDDTLLYKKPEQNDTLLYKKPVQNDTPLYKKPDNSVSILLD